MFTKWTRVDKATVFAFTLFLVLFAMLSET